MYIFHDILKMSEIRSATPLTTLTEYVILQLLYNKSYKWSDMMPPKAKISRDMIIGAGLDIIREQGQECLNVRSIAARLGCSTQPVMYHYKNVGALHDDLYKAADDLHTRFIMAAGNESSPMLNIGLNYIRFADKEKNLFRFLFQSGQLVNTGFDRLINARELDVLIQPLCKEAALTPEQGRQAFRSLFICVHGMASLLANNSLEYDEADTAEMLENTFMGIVGYLKRGNIR